MVDRRRMPSLIAASIIAAGALAGCASRADEGQPRERGGLFGFGFGRDDGDARGNERAEIGVNSLLYRATLETLSFMPLESQDPWGGVIITEWYNNPDLPNERFKATVYILDTRLRADALRVSLFRQVLTANGWMNADVDPATSIQIENAILTRARQLRLANEG